MRRHFNTGGVCRPELHYMLPPEPRLPDVVDLIEAQSYFVIHAARQVGKSTAVMSLAQRLTTEGKYVAIVLSMETGVHFPDDIGAAESAILSNWKLRAQTTLPDELLPPVWPAAEPGSRIRAALTEWARHCPRSLVVFLDEIDSLKDSVLEGILRQLRDGHSSRPHGFPWSLALVGMRDVRDYKLASGGQSRSHSASPFNVMTESLTMSNFTQNEVAELYSQHTTDTGQIFEPPAIYLAFELTQGQPWLVNALARQCVEVLVKDRSKSISIEHIEQAKNILLKRNDTHFDSLAERLREDRVRKVIEPMLLGGVLPNLSEDDRLYTIDLGLLVRTDHGLQVANPIYKEFIPRVLCSGVLDTLPRLAPSWLDPDGRISWDKLRAAFVEFWLQHGEPMMNASPYSEAAAHLVMMAFLYRVSNGGGKVDREYAIGMGRMDLCVSFKDQVLAIELKVWNDRHKRVDPTIQARSQIAYDMKRINANQGWIVLFDQRTGIAELADRYQISEEHTPDGQPLWIIRL